MNCIFFLSSNVAQDSAKICLLPWLLKRLKSLFEKSICPSDIYLNFVTGPFGYPALVSRNFISLPFMNEYEPYVLEENAL